MAERRTLKNYIDKVTQGRVTRGRVYAIDGQFVDVRPYNSANLLRHVPVVGDAGQILMNQEIAIYWRDDRPVVMSGVSVPFVDTTGTLGDADTLDGLDSTDFALADHAHDGIQVLGPNGVLAREFPPNVGGLESALSYAFENYQIILPPGTFQHSFSLSNGVHLSGAGMGATKILGNIAGGASLSRLTIGNYTSSASRTNAVNITGDNVSLTRVHMIVSNASGPASGILLNNGGNCVVMDSIIELTGTTTIGVEWETGSGKTFVIGCRIVAEIPYQDG